MATHCNSCGNPVPEGQFRCGRCGAPQDTGESDDELLDDSLGSSPEPYPERPAREAEESEAVPDVEEGAVSLPPPALEDSSPLELEPSGSSSSRPERPTPPAPEGGEREDDTEKRKTVPKGAFGEGSVVEKLPTAEEDDTEETSEHEAAVPGSSADISRKVSLLPGLEPTRHRDEVSKEDAEADDRAAKGAEADDTADPKTGKVAAPPAPTDTPLELDVSSGGMRSMPNRPRPPFLASEIMREEIIPERPGAHSIARLAQMLGVGAVLTYGLLALARPEASLWGLPALALLGLGVLKLGYVLRASLLAALAVGTCIGAAATGARPGPHWDSSGFSFIALWLSASLLLRFWYRGHRQPSWLVAIGVAAASVLGVEVLDHVGHWALTSSWYSWLPAVVAFAYLQLCLLSLLAFMGPETNAAGALWAVSWWFWYAAAHVIMALANSAAAGELHGLDAVADAALHSAVILTFVVPPGAFALAQLYAVALSRREPAADEPHIEAAAAE